MLKSFRSNKNSKLVYYLSSVLNIYLYPNWLKRISLDKLSNSINKRSDKNYIQQRVEYYCKLRRTTTISPDAPSIANLKFSDEYGSVYFFDSKRYLQYFNQNNKWMFKFGDIIDKQAYPSIVKSRPLCDDNENSVLLNLNKVRHFLFVKDRVPFERKQNRVIFRGEIAHKPRRIEFLEKHYHTPLVDAGSVGPILKEEWNRSKLSILEHLQFKFIMALEGNDVASNLKWIMSSNSIAVMPKPTCETWFMEGLLIPNYHYIEIKPDYSDLEERLQYYIDNPDQARIIVKNAQDWVAQFSNIKREKIISLLVLDKYFKMTGQSAK